MSTTETNHPTRERLVVAARDLFHAKGYTATGIAEILRKAGANSGSLYHYFPTKEDLLRAVLEWYRDNINAALLDPIWSNISDPIERIFALLHGYRMMLQHTEFSYGCPIGNLALELASTHPNIRELLAQNFTKWTAAVRECLDDASGRFPAHVNVNQLATFVLTTMEGAVMLARSYSRMEPFDAAVTQLRDYFDRLLADGSEWSPGSSPHEEIDAEEQF